MTNNKIYEMSFSSIYTALIEKITRKERNINDLYEITTWLTGYNKKEIEKLLKSDIKYKDFFLNAPNLNPNRKLITGTICGIKIENIQEPLMQEIRYLDKLVDELAKGKSIEKIKRG